MRFSLWVLAILLVTTLLLAGQVEAVTETLTADAFEFQQNNNTPFEMYECGNDFRFTRVSDDRRHCLYGDEGCRPEGPIKCQNVNTTEPARVDGRYTLSAARVNLAQFVRMTVTGEAALKSGLDLGTVKLRFFIFNFQQGRWTELGTGIAQDNPGGNCCSESSITADTTISVTFNYVTAYFDANKNAKLRWLVEDTQNIINNDLWAYIDFMSIVLFNDECIEPPCPI